MNNGKTMHRLPLVFLALALFSLSGCLTSGGDYLDTCKTGGISEWVNSWIGLAGLGIFVSVMALASLHMFAKAADIPQLEARVKTELWQIVVTMAITAMLVSVAATMCFVKPNDIGITNAQGNVFQVAEYYTEWVAKKTYNVLDEMLAECEGIAVLQSLNIGVTLMDIGAMSFVLFAGINPLMNSLNMVTNTAMIGAVIGFAQYVLLKFLLASMFNVILPIGIIARCFWFTREFGGALIAIAVGFYILYPLMLVADYIIIGQPTGNPGGVENLGDADTIGNGAFWAEAALSLIKVDLFGIVENMVITPLNALFIEVTLPTAIGGTASTMVYAFMLPALNGIILINFIRDLSKAIGVEVDVSSLTRMV